MTRCAIVGTSTTASQLVHQLHALPDEPDVQGVILFGRELNAPRRCAEEADLPVLGMCDQLEEILATHRISCVIISLPAAMRDAIASLRMRLRRIGVADRYIPTLQDQLSGHATMGELEVDLPRLIDRDPHDIDEAAIADTITGKRVLITGAGGSIGSELARMVASFNPSELFLMERSENALFEIDRQISRYHPDVRRGAWLHDVVDEEKTLEYLVAARPEVIFHAAAHKHVPMMEDHPREAVVNNFFGTLSIVDAAVQTGCERFVMVSTDKAVNPTSIMGATKRLAELYVQYQNQICDTQLSIVRFGNVLGSAGSVLQIWASQVRDGGPLTVTHPEMTRYFMTIPEAATLVVQAAALETVASPGDVLVLDMGEPIAILDLAKRFLDQYGLNGVVTGSDFVTGQPDRGVEDSDLGAADIPIVFTGIRPGEKLQEELVYAAEDMVPTAHPGIRAWSSVPRTTEQIADMMAEITDACHAHRTQSLIDAIHRAIPEMSIPAPTPIVETPSEMQTTIGAGESIEDDQSEGLSRVA